MAKAGKASLFQLPSADDWKDLVKDLRLSPTQASELDILIRHVHADLEWHLARRVDRDERKRLIKGRKEISKALAKLNATLRKHEADLGRMLPSGMFQALGRAMSAQEIEAALGVKLVSPDLARRMTDGGAPVSVADLETEYRWEREAVALKRGPDLLLSLLDKLAAPLDAWLELNRRNDGGRPASLARLLLIRSLAAASPAILGRQASGTALGPFAELCGRVLDVCGLESDGVEDVIEDVLKDRAARSKGNG